MNAVGIIAEYNPFHNGHLYQINKVKEMFPGSTIIIVLSGHFMQRGTPSILNKWDKTKIALNYGVDLVVELPFEFSSQSADFFAKGAVKLLEALKVNYLIFGSESGDLDLLTNIAIKILDEEYSNKIKSELKKGISYPNAIGKAINNNIKDPNDILAISYIKEIIKHKYKISPYCIKRTNSYHDLNLTNKITSASSIRESLKNNINIKNYVPSLTNEYLEKKLPFTDNYFNLLKYNIYANLECLDKFHGVDEGIENRIKKEIINSKDLNDLVFKIKSKRYTYNRIMRMFTYILINFTKREAKEKMDVNYIRILGFNNKGQQYLNKIKKEVKLPIISKYSKRNHHLLNLELKSTYIYASLLPKEKQIKLIKAETENKPIKM